MVTRLNLTDPGFVQPREGQDQPGNVEKSDFLIRFCATPLLSTFSCYHADNNITKSTKHKVILGCYLGSHRFL